MTSDQWLELGQVVAIVIGVVATMSVLAWSEVAKKRPSVTKGYLHLRDELDMARNEIREMRDEMAELRVAVARLRTTLTKSEPRPTRVIVHEGDEGRSFQDKLDGLTNRVVDLEGRHR